MTGEEQKLLSLTPLKRGIVSFENGKKGTVIGIEKIGRTEAKASEEVYHVDGLKYNLLSISQLYDKGSKVTFTSVGCKVKRLDTKEIILSTSRYKNVYKTDIIGMPGTNLTCLSAMDCDPLL